MPSHAMTVIAFQFTYIQATNRSTRWERPIRQTNSSARRFPTSPWGINACETKRNGKCDEETGRDCRDGAGNADAIGSGGALCNHRNGCHEIGRASCRERVCQYVSLSVCVVPFKIKLRQRY